jgi:hypothetical protein
LKSFGGDEDTKKKSSANPGSMEVSSNQQSNSQPQSSQRQVSYTHEVTFNSDADAIKLLDLLIQDDWEAIKSGDV